MATKTKTKRKQRTKRQIEADELWPDVVKVLDSYHVTLDNLVVDSPETLREVDQISDMADVLYRLVSLSGYPLPYLNQVIKLHIHAREREFQYEEEYSA